jgi:ATP-binding cassette, subfamily B, bacterial
MHKVKSNGFFINSFRCLKLIFKIHPTMTFLYIFVTFIHAISWVLQVLFMQRFLDAATNLSVGEINFGTILFSLTGMGVVYIFYHFMDGLGNCYEEIFGLSISKHLNKLIFKRIDALQAVEFEDTRRLEFINKAVNGSNKLIWVGATLIDIIFYYTTYFIFMGWYLFTLKPILAVIIVIVFLPCVFSQLVRVSMFKNLEEMSSPIRREYEYYERCLTDKEYFKETRLLGASDFFNDLYTAALKKLNYIVFIAQLKKNFINLVLNAVTVIGYGIIIYMLFISVMNKEISIGAFIALLTSMGNLYRFMNKLISERIAWASENVGSVENFLDFISEPIDNKRNIPKLQNFDIKLKGVSFKYPMASKKAVNNINLTIHNKQTVAIVGENGSGKTTLCRIIMGLYNPSEGEVFYGDVPAKHLSYDNTSAIFQKYCQYKMTLKENLEISQMAKLSDHTSLENICEKSGIHLESETYKDGLDTMLGRDFGGTDLSGGQWQRVAIARALFRHSDLMILDEPTAAIDPLEETRLYNDFSKISRDKTAIIVTHRLGSVKLADRIIVLKDGKIVQDGKHNELIKNDGEYKKMYESQKKWYLEKD